jgi:hypothetical protein
MVGFVLAIIEPERHFIQIAVKVERLDGNISASEIPPGAPSLSPLSGDRVGALPTWWTSPLSSAWVAGTLFGISLLLRLLPPAAHADRAPHTHRRGNLKTLSRKIFHPTHSIGNPDQNSPPQSSIIETVGKFNGSS